MHWTGSFVLALAQTGDLPQAFQQLLRLPSSGCFESHTVSRRHPVSDEQRQAAVAHLAKAMAECRLPETDDDRRQLALEEAMLLPAGPEQLSPLLRHLPSAAEHFEFADTLWFGDGIWRKHRRTHSTTGTSIHQHSVRQPDELIQWNVVEARVEATQRIALVRGERIQMDAVVLGVPMLYEKTSALLAVARAQDTLEVRQDLVEATASLRGMSTLRALTDRVLILGEGWIQNPGTARVSFRSSAESAELELVLEDCFGERLHEERALWGIDRDFPESVRTRVLLPVSGIVVAEVETSFHRSSDSERPETWPRWVPSQGELILDSRFGSTVSYEIEADGELPPDSWVAREAQDLAATFGDEEPQFVFDAASLPSSAQENEPPAAPRETKDDWVLWAGILVGGGVGLFAGLRGLREALKKVS